MLYADEMMFLNRKNNNQKYKFKNIEKHYLQAIKVYPDYWKSYNNYAFACLYFGYDDKAKGYIDKTLALKRSDKSLFNLSVYHQKKGNVSEELAILKKSLIKTRQIQQV